MPTETDGLFSPHARECLERRARDSRRATQVHLARARMLQNEVMSFGSAERIGTHLLRVEKPWKPCLIFSEPPRNDLVRFFSPSFCLAQ